MQTSAARLPGPPELLPGRPDAIVDLQSDAGLELLGARWRYHDARIEEIEFVDVGEDLGPSGPANRTYDITPHAEPLEFDDSAWQLLSGPETRRRLGHGRTSFNWYRLAVTIPERIGEFVTAGSTAVFEVVVDDYAEVWVNGDMPLALGQTAGQVAAGFNAPNRVVLSQDVRPGQRFLIAVFGINGPLSASPRNYIWMRSATLDFYRPERAVVSQPAQMQVRRVDMRLDDILPADARLERVAGDFEFTEGPVWSGQGYLLFSSPNTNAIYRWSPLGTVDVFRSKSGYTGADIGEYGQPGSNGLTFDPQGRLTMCQHGNRQILRVEPHGNTTVMADRYQGKRLNSPNDLVYRSDGTLFFTDPPFGLPRMFDDPNKELSFSGVYSIRNGAIALVTDELAGPNGIALSPDERFLYVGNWDPNRKVVMRYELAADGSARNGSVLFDMTDAPGEDAIDGLKVDQAGNLYVCGPGGIWILNSDGVHLGTLELPEAPHNLAWGDADGRTLYIAALTSIYRLRVNIRGMRPQ